MLSLWVPAVCEPKGRAVEEPVRGLLLGRSTVCGETEAWDLDLMYWKTACGCSSVPW